MNAIPTYTGENTVEVEYNGYVYPLILNFAALEKIQEECESLQNLIELLQNSKSRAKIFAILLNEARRVAAYYHLPVPPKVSALEIEVLGTVTVIRKLQEAVITAINKSVFIAKEENEDAPGWSEEELAAIDGMDLPETDKDEKNT